MDEKNLEHEAGSTSPRKLTVKITRTTGPAPAFGQLPMPKRPAAVPPASEMAGMVIKAIPDRYDPTQCYQWILRAANNELYRFDKRNIADPLLHTILQEKFEKKQQNNEQVQFKLLSFPGKNGYMLRFADQVRLTEQQVSVAPNEDAAASLSARYKEAVERFKGGKDYDNDVLPVFLEYFAENPGKEIVNNICMIYLRSYNPLESLDFLGKKNALIWLTEVELLNIQYQVYRKVNAFEKAFEVEKKIIAISDNLAHKRHHIELAIKFLLSCQRYDETIDYCTMWLDLGIGKSGDKNVSNVYRRRQIYTTAAECIVKLQNTGEYNPNKQLLKAIYADEQAAAILSAGAGEELSDHVFDDLGYMGVVAKDLIEGLNLLEAPARLKLLHQIIDPETGHFRGEPHKKIRDSAREIARRFTNNLLTEKPQDRYISCIYAARVLYDAFKEIRDRNEAGNDLEVEICKYLAKAMASKGDYTIAAKRTAIIEEARLYYTESIRYASGDEQDKVNAITRCVLSVFVECTNIPMTMQGDNNLSIQHISDYLKSPDFPEKLDIRLLLGVIVRIIASVPPNQTNSIQGKLVDAVYSSKCCAAIACELYSMTGNIPQEHVTQEGFKNALSDFRKKYSELENTFIRFMEQLAEQACFKREWIENTQKNLGSLNVFFRYVDDFDRKNCQYFMEELLNIASKYYNAEHYDEREDYLKNMIFRIDDRERSIQETPVQYSYEQLWKVLKAWKIVCIKELHGLYANNQPELDCEIIGDSIMSPDAEDIVKLNICISNKKERQKADDIEIYCDDPNGEYEVLELDCGSSRTIKGGGQKDGFLRFRLKSPNVKAVTVSVIITYTYKNENGDENKGRKEFPFNVFFGEKFKVDFLNPYASYSESGPVGDRSMTFGRDSLIHDTIGMLQGKNAMPLRSKMLLLYGQKRAGKSTVLLHLENEIREKEPDAIVVNIGDISESPSDKSGFEKFFYKRFFQRFTADLCERHVPFFDALQTEGIVIPGDEQLKDAADGRYEMGSFFDRFNRYIASQNTFARKTVVVLLDEFTNLYSWMEKGVVDKEFMKYWKAMISGYKLVAIAAAHDYIGDFIRDYPNEFGTTELIQVDYLTEEAVRDMIRKPFADNAFMAAFEHKMGEEAINRIMRLTAGNAYFAMIFLDRLVDYLNESNQPIVMPVTVENVLKKKILGGNNPFLLEKFESLYNDDGDIRDPNRPMHNLTLLWTVAQRCDRGGMWCAKDDIIISDKIKDAGNISQERINFLIDKLVKRRVLIREEGRDAYRIRVDMFREWLLANCGADFINAYKQPIDSMEAVL